MPYPVANISKATARQALSFRCGDWWPLSTSSAGNAGGTTAVFASIIGRPVSSIQDKYLLLTSGTNAGEWRECTDFAPATGTITVARAFTNQVATSVTAELHSIRPELYTLGLNEAIYKAYSSVYRPVESPLVLNFSQDYLGLPRNMRDLLRVRYGGAQQIKDLFDRAASTTLPGGNWVETTGNWGITSERLYCESDANGDMVTQDPDVRDGYIQGILRGDNTPAAGTDYRTLALLFRIAEDRNGAIDTNNYLLVRLYDGAVDLRKVDGGAESSLATFTTTTTNATDYLVGILFEGNRIRVWLDDQEIIRYELLGLNLKYREYPRVGIRCDRAGTPTGANTTAQCDDYYCYSLTPLRELETWEATADRVSMYLRGVGGGRLIWLEGRAPLTELSADTTYEAIASDATLVLEIQTGDPAWQLYLDTARYLTYEHMAQPANTASAEARATYMQQAGLAWAEAQKSKEALGMHMPPLVIRHP